MKRKDPVCPACGSNNVDASLKCQTCGENLEYSDRNGTLRKAEKERRCPKCNTVNSSDSKYCKSCGALITRHCSFCDSEHFIEDLVCPVTGVPFDAKPSEETSTASQKQTEKSLSIFMITAGIIALIFFIFLIYRSYDDNRPYGKPVPVIVVEPTPDNGVIYVQQPRIDVVFVVDTTASMGDEIEVVKAEIRKIVNNIAGGQPQPYVRYGLVAYRDRGDTFVTRRYTLNHNIRQVHQNINELAASGGGDTEESVNEALNVAINQMNWDNNDNTRKIVFLIGDAGPHMDYSGDYDYRQVARQAKERGIKIYAIGCSGITSSGESEFREIANISGGIFEYLTYQQTYSRADGTTVDVLTAGDKSYEVTGGEKDEWKGGYRTMVSERKAKSFDASAPAAPGKAIVKPASAMKNNLDSILTQEVKKEAEAAGVKYEKPKEKSETKIESTPKTEDKK